MATKIITLSQPSITFTNTIDWYLGDVFNTIAFSDLSINFLNAIDGKRIIISLTNGTLSSINLNFIAAVQGAASTIPSNTTQIYTLTKIANVIYASLESSTPYGVIYDTAGTYTTVAPSTATKMKVIIIPSTGGGGGGAFEKELGSGSRYLGGAGGGGGYAPAVIQSLDIIGGRSYSIVVGTGGTAGAYPSGAWWDGGAGGNGGDGQISTIKETTTQQILLSVEGGKGGKGGINPASTNPVTIQGSGGAGGAIGGASGGDGSYVINETKIPPSGGLGGVHPLKNSSKGGNGGRGGGNGGVEGYASAGQAGTSAVILITYQ